MNPLRDSTGAVVRGALLAAAAVLLGGCGTASLRADRDRPAENAGIVRVSLNSGSENDVPPGSHLAQATVTWSNGTHDATLLGFDAMPGATYRVMAYEAGRGAVPAALELVEPPHSGTASPDPHRPKRDGEVFAERALGVVGEIALGVVLQLTAPVIVLTAPVWIPIALAASKPRYRPAPDCCFVWLEDADTGVTVAGRSPWTPPPDDPTPVAPATVAYSGPPAGDDERVNCVADGVRQWTWRSRCE